MTVMVDQVLQDLPLTSCGISPPASPNPSDSAPPAAATAPNSPPVLDSEGTQLQQLLTRTPIVYEDIQTHINSYTDYAALVIEVNGADKNDERPLHLALASGRADVVELLLKNDALVQSDSSRFIRGGRTENEVLRTGALLHFHAYLQRGATGEDPYVGKALSLINQCGESLRHHVAVQNAVVVIGETRKGKSSLINCVHCTDYLKEKVGMFDYRLTPDPQQDQTCKLQTITSSSYESETICPQIVFSGEEKNMLALVDTPGTWESRALPWKIAGGVSMQLLAQHIQTLKAIVVVFTVGDLKIESAAKIRNTLAIAAAAVHEDVSLLKHVVFVANQAGSVTAADVALQFELIRQDLKKIKKCSPEMDFLLSLVKQIKIIVVDTPAAEFRTDVLSHLDTLSSTSFSRFDFAAYHHEALKFSAMTKSVVDYHRAEQQEWSLLQQFAEKELHGRTRVELDFVRGQPQADLEAVASMIREVPNETKDAFTQQATYFKATDRIRKLLISELQLLQEATASSLPTPAGGDDQSPDTDTDSSSIPLGNVMTQLSEKQCRLSISASFINVVLPYLQQEKLLDMDFDDDDVFGQFDYQTCSGSAWPFPGACAGSQHTTSTAAAAADWAFQLHLLTSGVAALSNGITWGGGVIYDISRQALQSLVFKWKEIMSARDLASLLKLRVTPLDTRSCGSCNSSATASACLHQWSGAWKYILPSLVEQSDATTGNALVPVCLPEQNTVRIWVTELSSVTVWTTAEGTRSVTVDVSGEDSAVASRSNTVLINSFATGFFVQLARVLSADCSEFMAQLCVMLTTMATVTLFTDPAVAMIVLAQWVVNHCLLSSHIGQILAPYAYLMIVVLQVSMELEHIWFVLLRLFLSMLGSRIGIALGGRVGLELRRVTAHLW